MNNLLNQYIHESNNPVYNFELAVWYESQKQYSPACSFYLRTIQFTSDSKIIYESLIRMFFCFDALGSRDHTSEHLLKSAINTIPEIPHAYHLLCQFYEKKQNWMDMYMFSTMCLKNCDFNITNFPIFKTKIDFAGKYIILFHKAISSWWYGKPEESRNLFQDLMINYIDDLNYEYYSIIQNNIAKIGTGSKSQSSIKYSKDKKESLRFPIKNIDNIEYNFSQIMQDMFVLSLLNGKTNGTYLEVGAADPFVNSNTALLEKFGWYGIGIDNNENFVKEYKNHRKNPILLSNANIINYKKLLSHYFPNIDIIDYLQLDIEPCHNTFEALLAIPFDKYKFRIITYEHDYYIDMTKSYRQKSRNYLSSLGYVLLYNDLSTDSNSPFEDWWIKPDLIDTNILDTFLSVPINNKINPIEKIMFK